ncbi:MAG: cyclic pyranopterin monophosphate synthase MoaC [Blautia faecis]
MVNIVIKGTNAMENKLTHFDENGNAVMVDVSDKPVTPQNCHCHRRNPGWSSEIMEHLTAGTVAKGVSCSGVARVAGIMSVKHTSDLGANVPSWLAGHQMCH